ncbi:MAG: PadR family transcriptional regulator [Candidatus Gastranaerophilaceae bacterium]
MIELLILFFISKRELTMYGIQKSISDYFSSYTKPSFGALNPALKRLEHSKCLTSRKSLSEGGKQFCYYSITKEGINELKKLLLEDFSENPVQFFSNARLKLSCAGVLSDEELDNLYTKIKTKAYEHKFNAENTLNNEYISLDFHQRIVLDNTLCELQNFISIVEELEKQNAGNSK